MRFIDLFAGLGGFHLALKEQGHQCVFASEIQEDLRKYYERNFSEIDPVNIIGDIHSFPVKKIPDHDILCAGFPCQPFSQAGKRKGLNDPTNGNHFVKIMDILDYHKPTFLLLENVRTLEGHNNGLTWKIIYDELNKNYEIKKEVFSPHQFGIPQHRKRLYIVGKRRDKGGLNYFNFDFNGSIKTNSHISSVVEQNAKDFIKLKPETNNHLGVWQEFLDHLKKEDIPKFPIWVAEFGATYPYENKSTFMYTTRALTKCKGTLGRNISGRNKKEILNCLPPYVRKGDVVFPNWKIRYIKKNREFYLKHKDWLDDWMKKVKNWEHSHQKFEWNCGEAEPTLKDKIIQFRPSGIRVKNPDKSPALVLPSTQIPIIFDEGLKEFRYLNGREAARLQSMENLKYLPDPMPRAIRALGNAVNVKVVSNILKKLIIE
jgi:DNA (cytosine-5)-methyltransferase 1